MRQPRQVLRGGRTEGRERTARGELGVHITCGTHRVTCHVPTYCHASMPRRSLARVRAILTAAVCAARRPSIRPNSPVETCVGETHSTAQPLYLPPVGVTHPLLTLTL